MSDLKARIHQFNLGWRLSPTSPALRSPVAGFTGRYFKGNGREWRGGKVGEGGREGKGGLGREELKIGEREGRKGTHPVTRVATV